MVAAFCSHPVQTSLSHSLSISCEWSCKFRFRRGLWRLSINSIGGISRKQQQQQQQQWNQFFLIYLFIVVVVNFSYFATKQMKHLDSLFLSPCGTDRNSNRDTLSHCHPASSCLHRPSSLWNTYWALNCPIVKWNKQWQKENKSKEEEEGIFPWAPLCAFVRAK